MTVTMGEPVTGTLTQIPMIRRRKPLRSKTTDTLFHILSVCYNHQVSDGGDTDIGPVTKDDVPLDCTDILPNDSLCQEDTSMDETRVVLDTQEECLFNTQPEFAELDHNTVGETTDLCHNVDVDPSVSVDVNDQDNLMDLMMSSPPPLPTDKNVEEGEISGDFMDFTPDDFIGIESQLENDNNLILLSTVAVEDVGKDMTGIVNKNTRNLVDYSEIVVHGNSRESAKQATAVTGSDSSLRRSGRLLSFENNLRNSKTRNQDLVNPVKRQGSSTEEERVCKKAKKLVDLTTAPQNSNSVGKHHGDASQEVVDASMNQDAANQKKKKRVVTQESRANKKRKNRIKRAEKRKELGVIRPKLELRVKEKKISICRHYMHGKCHEGEKCKFSHDTIPLTKSKPCCHFARHACMKGDDCPYDHQLSKYLCDKLLSTGECYLGSRCMFSHYAVNAVNVSVPDQESPNSGSKRVDAKSCSTPKAIASNTERNPADITPKVFTRPPKGISFLSQKRSPLESRSSPNVDSGVKETTKTPSVTQDPKEITKTPPVVPRGINFLSFGKKPDLGNSNGGFSFKISNGIGKSPLGKLEGEGSKSDPAVNVVTGVKADLPTDRPSFSQKPLPMMSFLSSTSQKAVQSTLAFASKFDSGVKTIKPGYLTQKI